MCEEGWTGVDCGVRECSINCGQHGACENMECVCEKGIFGASVILDFAILVLCSCSSCFSYLLKKCF